MTAKERRIWVATDGRPGNENPALGLAQSLQKRLEARGERTDLSIHRLAIKPWATVLPAPLWRRFGTRPSGWPFSAAKNGAAFGQAALSDEDRPDLIISAGRRSAPIVAALGALTGGEIKTVQLLNPKMGTNSFDLIIAPAHDGLAGPRVLSTVGSLHKINPNAPPPADPRFPAPSPDAPSPFKVALLIGGKSKSASFGEVEQTSLLEAIKTLHARGASIVATASRRTPKDYADKLRAAIEAADGFFWDGGGDNPYLAMLFWADALIVTADSVNMASEACALGKPVYVAPAQRLASKFEQFHAALRAGEHIRPLAELNAATAQTAWTPHALDDMQAATDAVIRLLDG